MEAKADSRDDSVRTTVQNLMSECENLLAELGDEGTRRYRNAVTGMQRQMRQTRDDLDDLQYSAVRRARKSRSAAPMRTCTISPGSPRAP
jgi:ElaB/YqjD/DUF883 family membrane-anchored ribosome-binding protein